MLEMAWFSVAVFLFLEGTALVLAQNETATVNLTLVPPATSDSGVLSFSYCQTSLVSVKATCTVTGVESSLRILPQVVIGPDHFYLNNEAMLAKWGITVFSQNDTLLCFALPLTGATNGLSIHCQSEQYSSPSIILQSDNGLCVNPTPTTSSTSSLSTDVDPFPTPSSSISIDETMSTLFPAPSSQPGVIPVHLPGAIAGAVVVLVLFVTTIVIIVCVPACRYWLKRNAHNATTDLRVQTPPEQELTGVGLEDSGLGTLQPEPHNHILQHQGSPEVDQDTNGDSQ